MTINCKNSFENRNTMLPCWPQRLAHPHFLHLAFGHEGHQPVQTQAANEDGHPGQHLEQFREPVFRLVEPRNGFVEEAVLKHEVGEGGRPHLLDGLYRAGQVLGTDLEAGLAEEGLVGGEDARVHALAERIQVEVLSPRQQWAWGTPRRPSTTSLPRAASGVLEAGFFHERFVYHVFAGRVTGLVHAGRPPVSGP
jgi:hypothetical protein